MRTPHWTLLLLTLSLSSGCKLYDEVKQCDPPLAEQLCADAQAQCGPLSHTDACGVAHTLECGICPLLKQCGEANQCADIIAMTTKYPSPDQDNGSGGFGESVAVSGPWLVTGGSYMRAGASNERTGRAFTARLDTDGPQRMTPLERPDLPQIDRYGSSVAIAGSTLAVGAYSSDDRAGRVFLYELDPTTETWVQQHVLFRPPDTPSDLFGRKVRLTRDGQHLLVTTQGKSGNANTEAIRANVFIYERTPEGAEPWTLRQRLSPPFDTLERRPAFADSLDVRGDMIVVGAYLDSREAENGGVVYTYRRSNATGLWEPEQTLRPPENPERGYFGRAVALGDDVLFISSSGVSRGPGGLGVVDVYRRDDTGRWAPVFRISPELSQVTNSFGRVLLWTRGVLFAGLPSADFDTANADDRDQGAINLYAPDAEDRWLPLTRITEPQPIHDAGFGGALATDDRHLLIGSRGNSEFTVYPGAIHHLDLDTILPP